MLLQTKGLCSAGVDSERGGGLIITNISLIK